MNSTTTASSSTLGVVSHGRSKETSAADLLEAAEKCHVKPLWTQMSKLNPPLPNPRCKPHVWEYDAIRPTLLEAGQLITEKQAERRVLMLVNPERGEILPQVDFQTNRNICRSTFHNRHNLRGTSACYA